jgi:hypothetical protein
MRRRPHERLPETQRSHQEGCTGRVIAASPAASFDHREVVSGFAGILAIGDELGLQHSVSTAAATLQSGGADPPLLRIEGAGSAPRQRTPPLKLSPF